MTEKVQFNPDFIEKYEVLKMDQLNAYPLLTVKILCFKFSKTFAVNLSKKTHLSEIIRF